MNGYITGSIAVQIPSTIVAAMMNASPRGPQALVLVEPLTQDHLIPLALVTDVAGEVRYMTEPLRVTVVTLTRTTNLLERILKALLRTMIWTTGTLMVRSRNHMGLGNFSTSYDMFLLEARIHCSDCLFKNMGLTRETMQSWNEDRGKDTG
jgi:hypothetical protein